MSGGLINSGKTQKIVIISQKLASSISWYDEYIMLLKNSKIVDATKHAYIVDWVPGGIWLLCVLVCTCITLTRVVCQMSSKTAKQFTHENCWFCHDIMFTVCSTLT